MDEQLSIRASDLRKRYWQEYGKPPEGPGPHPESQGPDYIPWLEALVAQLEEALTVDQLLDIRSRLLLKKEYHKGYLPGLIGGINALIKALGGEI